MTTFKLTLEYDGTGYRGWQAQKDAVTVVGELRAAAAKIFRSEFDIQGAGRTDAGVHALAQVAHIKLAARAPEPPESLLRQLNELLPASIAILSLERAPNLFHARHSARSRVYRYQISTRKQAFRKKYVWWVKEPLDVKAMSRAASLLVGRRDFVRFRAEDRSRPDESTIVVVESATVEEEADCLIVFRIEASHFVWKMVRRLVGALVKIGKGELSEAEFERLLDPRVDSGLEVGSWTAPASGLFLEQVRY